MEPPAPTPAAPASVTSPNTQFAEIATAAVLRARPVSLRLLLQLYDPKAKQYRLWKGTHHVLQLDAKDPQVGMHLRQALQVWTDALTTAGPERVSTMLAALVAESLPAVGLRQLEAVELPELDDPTDSEEQP